VGLKYGGGKEKQTNANPHDSRGRNEPINVAPCNTDRWAGESTRRCSLNEHRNAAS
jgi:hypothetical protein